MPGSGGSRVHEIMGVPSLGRDVTGRMRRMDGRPTDAQAWKGNRGRPGRVQEELRMWRISDLVVHQLRPCHGPNGVISPRLDYLNRTLGSTT